MSNSWKDLSTLLELRPCTPEEYDFVAEVYNHYIHLGNCTMDTVPKTREGIQEWVDNYNDREGLFICAEVETGNPVGWCVVKKYSDRPGYRFACEVAKYLVP